MSYAINSSTLSLTSWRRLGLTAFALFGLINVPSFAQDEEMKESKVVVMRAPDDAIFSISSSGTLSLTLPRAPTSGSGVNLKIVNSGDFAIWGAPLSRSGSAWTTKINREAAQALLIANAVKAEFPGAAQDGKALQVSFLREQFQSHVGSLAGLAGSDALFYTAPDAPATFTIPSSLSDRPTASSFAMAARRYDEQLTAYYHHLAAQHDSAYSLWLDLNTAGRLSDWPKSAISTQESAYKSLDKKKSAVAGQKSDHRQNAAALIKQWNSASGAAEPVNLEFRDSS